MRIFTQENFAIADCAAKEAGRYAICGLHVAEKATSVTDGRVLVIVEPLEIDESKEKWFNDPYAKFIQSLRTKTQTFVPFIFPRKAAKKVVADIVSGKREQRGAMPSAFINDDVNTVVDGGIVTRAAKLEGIFPRYEQIIPSFKPAMKIKFHAKTLLSVLRVMGAYCNIVTISLCEKSGESCRIRIDAVSERGQKWTAVIMGCVPEKGDEVPSLEFQAVEFLKSCGYSVEKK